MITSKYGIIDSVSQDESVIYYVIEPITEKTTMLYELSTTTTTYFIEEATTESANLSPMIMQGFILAISTITIVLFIKSILKILGR